MAAHRLDRSETQFGVGFSPLDLAVKERKQREQAER
jgi:hypothetical protein